MPRADKEKHRFLLDLPVPVPVDVTPYRCSKCQHSKATKEANYFPVQIEDILAEFPAACVCSTARDGVMLASPWFLLHLLHLLHEDVGLSLS